MDQSSAPQKKQVSSPVNIPNALTVLRIILVPFFLYMLFQVSVTARWWAVGIFMVAAASDHLDGEIARRWNIITDFGKIADPIADKALTLGAFVALSILDPVLMPWWATILIAVRELGITWWRGVLLKRGVVVPANWGGKVKTTLQILLIWLMILPWSDLFTDGVPVWVNVCMTVVFYATLAMTVGSGLEYIWQGWKRSRS